MKPLLNWLKSNVLIVILGILAIVPLPVAYVVAGGMNKSLVEERQQSASSALSKLRSAKVTYSLPPLTENEQPVSETTAPNSEMTAYFRAERERREAQIAEIKAAAESLNQRGRGALVQGLFPEPAAIDSQLKRNEMARHAVAEGTSESAYDALFKRLRIRPPLDGAELGEQIAAQRDGQVAQITGDQGDGALTPEQREQLDAQMWGFRIGQYRAHAQDTVFYGTPALLPPAVPLSVPPAPPPLEQCFAWQFDYWLIEDVLSALAAANASLDPTGVGGNVLSGVVKRVDSVVIDPPPFAAGAAEGGPATITGRSQGGSDQYDIRYVDLSLIVSSAKLPALFDAIAASNLITVLDVDLVEIDPWADLAAGLYYGDDAVVQADLRLEVLYLRSWTAGFMPPAVREVLGVPDPASGDDDNGLG